MRLIGRKLLRLTGSAALGTNVMKEALHPLSTCPVLSKDFTAMNRSELTRSQNFLKNSIEYPSSPGALFEPQHQTAFLISSMEIGSSRHLLCKSDNFLKPGLKNFGLQGTGSENLFEKYLTAIFFREVGSEIHCPPSESPLILRTRRCWLTRP